MEPSIGEGVVYVGNDPTPIKVTSVRFTDGLDEASKRIRRVLRCKQCARDKEYKEGLCAKCYRRATSTPTYRKDVPSVGRNAPCPCKSGKKYKVCCKREA